MNSQSESTMKFEDRRRLYSKYFSIGNLNPISKDGHSSFERKLILISLINYVYSKNKPKNPDLTHYELICKLSKNLNLPEDFIKGLAIVCEDFAYACSEFPNFGYQGKEILKEIVEILDSYLPF